MACTFERRQTSQLLSSEINNIVCEIAEDEKLNEFEIQVKEQSFTGDNYIGSITRIKLEALKNGQKTIHLIMKSAPTTPVTRESMPVTQFYKNEIFTYNDILPALDKVQADNNIPAKERFPFAKLYKGSMDEFKEMILMKDLSADGYILNDKWTPMNFEHASLAIKNLARFHASSFVLKEKDPAKFSVLTENLPRTQNYGGSPEKMGSQSVEGIIKSVDLANRSKIESFGNDIIAGAFINSLDSSLTDPYNVICHGDCWNNNMLFKYENGKVTDVILIDWQIVRFASPATDIAYMLCLSLDENLLDLHLNDLLDIYYDALQNAITIMGCDPNICYPEEVFREHCKRILVFGLVMALMAMPYTLAVASEAKRPEEFLEDQKNGVTNINIGEVAAKRMNSVINYFVKNDLI